MALIDGKKIAEQIEKELIETDAEPVLKIVFVGENPASKTFVDRKLEVAERIGFRAELVELPADISEEELIAEIEELNRSEADGILVQLPLPEHIDENRIFENLDPVKDVDSLTPLNMGRIMRGESSLAPAAVEAILEVLDRQNFELEAANAVIINNSSLIGRPLSMILTQKGATVTICNEQTENLAEHTQEADLVVTATGQPGVINAEMIKERALVIDAGYSLKGGDIQEIDEISEKADLMSVPGGIGPITVALTMKNLLKLYKS